MCRDKAGRCPEDSSGNHGWIDITSKDDDGRKHYICRNCCKEAIE